MARSKIVLLIFCFWYLSDQGNKVSSAVSSCHNSKLRGSSGTFTSPNYGRFFNAPEKIENQDLTCKWEIEVPLGKGIQLKFGDFDMNAPKSPDDCSKGEVEVSSGIGKEKRSLDTYCPGNNPDTVIVLNNTATVEFRRPPTFDGSGFLISYIAITPQKPIDDFVTCSDMVNLQDGEATFSVVCPSGCGSIESHKVYGDLTYRDENTHLCRAAIHAGVISDLFGGRVEVKRISYGEALYLPGTANNVSALSAATSDYKVQFPASKYCRDMIPLKESQFVASSYVNLTDEKLGIVRSWLPSNAFFGTSLNLAWSPKPSNKSQWIQVNLEKIMKITGIMTRGSEEPYSQTTLFRVKYSDNGLTWHYYKETGESRPKVFAGNHNFHLKVTNNFVEPAIEARHIRVYPIVSPETCVRTCGLKVALTGCDIPEKSSTPELSTTPYVTTTTSKTTKNTIPTTSLLQAIATSRTSNQASTSAKQFVSSDHVASTFSTSNRTLILNVHDTKPDEIDEVNENDDNPDVEVEDPKDPDMNERTIVIIAIVAGLGVTCLLLATLVLILVRKRKKLPQESMLPKITSRDNATYNTELGMNSIRKNNLSENKKPNSQHGIEFSNGNYRETLTNATSGNEDSFLNSRGGVTLRAGQQQGNGIAMPVRASYSTNSDGMAAGGLVGNILYDESFAKFAGNDDDHEYQVILDPDPLPKGPSSQCSNASGNQDPKSFHGQHSHGDAWNRRSYGDYPQRMTSFAPLEPEGSSSGPIRSGTLPHKRHNNIHGDEALPLIPTSSNAHHSSFTAPRSSHLKLGHLPPKKSGLKFTQHPHTSRSSSSSQNSGSSDLHSSNNFVPETVNPGEDAQLLQQRGRKASYNIPNSIPVDPPHLSTFSSDPASGMNGGPTFSNGVSSDNNLRHSNSRTESLNHARLRSGYDQLYKATPTSDVSVPKAKMSTNDYNQLNLHSSAA